LGAVAVVLGAVAVVLGAVAVVLGAVAVVLGAVVVMLGARLQCLRLARCVAIGPYQLLRESVSGPQSRRIPRDRA
jgi:hypothetical protein